MLESLLKRVSELRVLMVGDAIIDEYCYVKPLAKSPKEDLLPTEYAHREVFRGGVWAAARHVAGFCAEVDVNCGGLVRTKRRYVEEERLRKLFEVQESSLSDLPTPEHPIDAYDLVIVTDFGHGCVTPAMITALIEGARFLAVNVQTNSANYGFNLITKYPSADYVVIDELEARLAVHDRDSPIERVVEALGFERIVVTLGSRGSIGYDGSFYRAPSRSSKIVDTMGAGDAFFSVTAPLAAAGADMQTLLEAGNAAGALKCAVVGHRAPVTKAALLAALRAGAGQRAPLPALSS
jgi:bifunctional ADP-heptose synthase (sugar kinase/adenylyltransferase)